MDITYRQILVSLLFLCRFLNVSTWSVQCDSVGQCDVTFATMNTSMYILPGELPLYPEKGIQPLKNTKDYEPSLTPNTKIGGYSVHGKLSGSKEYLCAGGLSECISSCCNRGFCSDPMIMCTVSDDNAKMIIIIVGSIFAGYIIIYWIVYYLLGVFYNRSLITDEKNKQHYGTTFNNLPNELLKNQVPNSEGNHADPNFINMKKKEEDMKNEQQYTISRSSNEISQNQEEELHSNVEEERPNHEIYDQILKNRFGQGNFEKTVQPISGVRENTERDTNALIRNELPINYFSTIKVAKEGNVNENIVSNPNPTILKPNEQPVVNAAVNKSTHETAKPIPSIIKQDDFIEKELMEVIDIT